jgi:hypothetical protein
MSIWTFILSLVRCFHYRYRLQYTRAVVSEILGLLTSGMWRRVRRDIIIDVSEVLRAEGVSLKRRLIRLRINSVIPKSNGNSKSKTAVGLLYRATKLPCLKRWRNLPLLPPPPPLLLLYCHCSRRRDRCLWLAQINRTVNFRLSARRGYQFIIRDDSKLLSGFSWPIIIKPEIIKLLTEYESVTLKVL